MIERRIKAAKFPATKSLDSFDYKVIPSLNKVLTMQLARCEFVDHRENVIRPWAERNRQNPRRTGAGTGGLPKKVSRFASQLLVPHWFTN